MTLLPELVDDSLHEVHTRAPSAIPDLRIGPYVGASRAACRLRLTATALHGCVVCRGRASTAVSLCSQEVVSVLKETMETTPGLLLPILDAVSGFSLPPQTLEGVHQHVMGTCDVKACGTLASFLHCCRKAPSHAIPPVRAGMLQAIPEASIACVTRFLFQTCRVDQVGTVYEAVATCLHSVDVSGKCKC